MFVTSTAVFSWFWRPILTKAAVFGWSWFCFRRSQLLLSNFDVWFWRNQLFLQKTSKNLEPDWTKIRKNTKNPQKTRKMRWKDINRYIWLCFWFFSRIKTKRRHQTENGYAPKVTKKNAQAGGVYLLGWISISNTYKIILIYLLLIFSWNKKVKKRGPVGPK